MNADIIIALLTQHRNEIDDLLHKKIIYLQIELITANERIAQLISEKEGSAEGKK